MKERDASITFKPLGVIRTPYTEDDAPFQAPRNGQDEARLVLYPEYEKGLKDLQTFKYIYVLFHLDRARKRVTMTAHPPWAGGKEVGLFASRSPNRPNPIGLSIVKIKEIRGREVITSPLDAFDGTPLLDIKPYIKDLDVKEDANHGWMDEKDREHFKTHIKGVPHI